MEDDDFASELPRVLGVVIGGLQERSLDTRRAARQAIQSVVSALGPTWLGWILSELRSRLNRGYMLPICTSATLAALQALTQNKEKPLEPGDLDGGLDELMAQVSQELDSAFDSWKPEAEQEESHKGQVQEAKSAKGHVWSARQCRLHARAAGRLCFGPP
jgi:U3 small nucleolar RNA-associated protein 20